MSQRRSKTPTNRQITNEKSLLYQSKPSAPAQRQGVHQGKTQATPVYNSIYKTQDPTQIKPIASTAKYYDTAVEISNMKTEFKFIKEHVEECKIDSSIIVKDMSLSVKAGQEDEAFAFEPQLWLNFRRGNTILQIYDPSNYESLIKTVIGRKGLNKFFDIDYNSVSAEGRYRDNDLSSYQQNIKNITLAAAKKAILEGHKVEVLKTLKANGENTQISYSPDINAWVIASKNVGMVARDIKDLDLYSGKSIRYSFAQLMARCWFTLISEFKKKDLEALKQDASNRTFIGEYIGNIECQHLVKYPRETIIFYAIVDNNSPKICKLPEDSYKIFKKYGFDAVKVDCLGVYNDYDIMCEDLQKEYVQVSGKTIREEEEGAVLYMIKRHKEDPNRDEVLSLSKFKTLEYRLFRKMREKLRNFAEYKTKATSDALIERFIKEAKDLCRDLQLPHPIEFYIDLCITAFQLITRGPKKDVNYFTALLLNEYIHFLEEVIITNGQQNFSKKRYTGKVSFDSIILDNQSAVNYQGYLGPRYRQVKPQQQTSGKREGNHITTPHVLKTLGNNIILIAPPLGMEKDAIEALQNEFPNFIETDHFQREFLERGAQDPASINFIFLTSLSGLKDAESHTDKIYYFVFNYTKNFLNNECIERFHPDSRSHYFCPKVLDNVDISGFQHYINEEISMFDQAMATLQQKSNVEMNFNNEKELITRIMWAKGRVCPVIIDKSKRQQQVSQQQQQTVRQVQIVEPPSVLKKSVKEIAKEEEKDEKNKKKVTINDVPQYELKPQNQSQVYVRKTENLISTSEVQQRQAEFPQRQMEYVQRQVDPQPQIRQAEVPQRKNDYVQRSQAEIPPKKTEYVQRQVDPPVRQEETQRYNQQQSNGNGKPMLNNNNTQTLKPRSKQISVILPIGIPGMGKTNFIEKHLRPYFSKLSNCYFTSFSSDQIRKKCIDEFLASNPGKRESDAFDSTYQKSANIFFKTLTDKLEEAIQDNNYESYIICLDKNHPPSALSRTIETINKVTGSFQNRYFKLLKVAMIPSMAQNYQDYPFSLNFLLQCYLRCLDREYHETLSNEDPNNLARVQISFFKSYQGIKFDSDFLQSNRLDDFMRVPLTFEDKELELPYNLQVCLDKCLKLTSSGVPQPHQEFERFVQLTNIYRAFFNGSSGHEHEVNYLLEKNFKSMFLTEKSIQQSLTPEASHYQIETTKASYIQTEQPRNIMNNTNEQSRISKETTRGNSQSKYEIKQKMDQNTDINYKTPDYTINALYQSQSTPSLQKREGGQQTRLDMGSFTEQRSFQPTLNQSQSLTQEETPQFAVRQAQEFKQYKPKAQQDQEEQQFEQYAPMRKIVQAKKQHQKIPQYLGISLSKDSKLESKMRHILVEELKVLVDQFGGGALKDTYQSLLDIWVYKKKDPNGWVKPKDMHVTTYFVGRDEEKTLKPIYQEFEEDVRVQVEIVAIVFVPGKIITGICFPQYPVDNKCPHVTLMTNEWLPQMSNNLLEITCLREKTAFVQAYEDLRTTGRVNGNQIQKAQNIKIDMKSAGTSSCYFLALSEPIILEGVTMIYN